MNDSGPRVCESRRRTLGGTGHHNNDSQRRVYPIAQHQMQRDGNNRSPCDVGFLEKPGKNRVSRRHCSNLTGIGTLGIQPRSARDGVLIQIESNAGQPHAW
jgi:hypothetical protein